MVCHIFYFEPKTSFCQIAFEICRPLCSSSKVLTDIVFSVKDSTYDIRPTPDSESSPISYIQNRQLCRALLLYVVYEGYLGAPCKNCDI